MANFMPEPYAPRATPQPMFKGNSDIGQQIRHFCSCKQEHDHTEQCLSKYLIDENLLLCSFGIYAKTKCSDEVWGVILHLAKSEKEYESPATQRYLTDCRKIVSYHKFVSGEKEMMIHRFKGLAQLYNCIQRAKNRLDYLEIENTCMVRLLDSVIPWVVDRVDMAKKQAEIYNRLPPLAKKE